MHDHDETPDICTTCWTARSLTGACLCDLAD